jgi:hypothetical protein
MCVLWARPTPPRPADHTPPQNALLCVLGHRGADWVRAVCGAASVRSTATQGAGVLPRAQNALHGWQQMVALFNAVICQSMIL